MEIAFLEKVNAGLMYLYGVREKEEFYARLREILDDLLGRGRFSLLMVGDDRDMFHLDYSSEVRWRGFGRPLVQSEALRESLACAARHEGKCLGVPWVDVAGTRLPVASVTPIGSGGRPLAVLLFHEDPIARVSEEGREAWEYVLGHVCDVLERVLIWDSVVERLAASESRLGVLREMGDLLRVLDLESLLSHLMGVYVRLTEAEVGSVLLSGEHNVEVEWGLPARVVEKIRKKGGRPILGEVLESGKSVFVPGGNVEGQLEGSDEFRVESFFCVPLVSRDRVLGAVNLVNVGMSRDGVLREADKAAMESIASLAATAVENALLHKLLVEKERIRTGLEIARTIQRGMYPVESPCLNGYATAWTTRSCEETGGDYFDFLTCGGGKVGFAIGDVSGHGIGAALLMAAGRANLRALLSVMQDLKQVAERLNDLLSVDMDGGRFMTLFIGALDPLDHTLTYVNGGHDLPLLYRRHADTVEDLESTGLPIGMMAGWAFDVRSTGVLQPGDVILLSTDGLWEATGPTGERFGKERLRQVLRGAAAGSAQEIVDTILEAVESYTRKADLADDRTAVVIKRVG